MKLLANRTPLSSVRFVGSLGCPQNGTRLWGSHESSNNVVSMQRYFPENPDNLNIMAILRTYIYIDIYAYIFFYVDASKKNTDVRKACCMGGMIQKKMCCHRFCIRHSWKHIPLEITLVGSCPLKL